MSIYLKLSNQKSQFWIFYKKKKILNKCRGKVIQTETFPVLPGPAAIKIITQRLNMNYKLFRLLAQTYYYLALTR